MGSILLSLPISTKNGANVDYIDALFTATTSTCVTGLVTVPTFSTWSLFGQIVILILIQIGGLGVVAFMAAVMIIINKKLKIISPKSESLDLGLILYCFRTVFQRNTKAFFIKSCQKKRITEPNFFGDLV